MEVILGLGSNLGNRLDFLRRALREILFSSIRLKKIRVSSVYESPALLPPSAPASWNQNFYNLAVRGETSLFPQQLLAKLKEIEKNLGRTQRERWAPREIDLDILSYGCSYYREDGLEIPHPEVFNRAFALKPLVEVSQDWVHPRTKEFAIDRLKKSTFEKDLRVAAPPLLPLEIVGILNLTHDSFSDGNRYLHPDLAFKHIEKLFEDGADVLDIGAESTNPKSISSDPSEEWRRLQPVFRMLKERSFPLRLSLDSRHSEVVEKSLSYGLDWLNDVSGLDSSEMLSLVHKNLRLDVVVMHSLSIPASNQVLLPRETDPVEYIFEWGRKKIADLARAGISKDRLILDPGIGFGKTPEQSLKLLQSLSFLRDWGVRILVGHSRKSFMSLFATSTPLERDLETAVFSGFLAAEGVNYVRVHEPGLSRRGILASLSMN